MAKAGRRTPTTPDDEGVERDVEGGAAIVPASLKGLDDDTVLIVTSFLPECRDVLSLSVTRALPETAWRAAHKSLLPGLHVARRRNEGQGKYWWCAMPDFSACGVADGPKSWRERFAEGARATVADRRGDLRRRRRHFRQRPDSARRRGRGVAGDVRRPAPQLVYQVRRNLPEFSLPDVHGGQPPRQLPIPWKN